jgi:hypothetical protein
VVGSVEASFQEVPLERQKFELSSSKQVGVGRWLAGRTSPSYLILACEVGDGDGSAPMLRSCGSRVQS